MPFKANRDRRHHIPKQRHQVTNWAEYDAALRARGSLTAWFTPEAVATWAAPRLTRVHATGAVSSRAQNGLLGVFPFAGRIGGGNCMPRTVWKADPTTDRAARDVLAAYDAAVRRDKPPVECCQAAVDAWVRAHPDQVRTYAARQALDVVLGARVQMRE